MFESMHEYTALAALLHQSLKIADELELDLVAIRISEAIDQLQRERREAD